MKKDSTLTNEQQKRLDDYIKGQKAYLRMTQGRNQPMRTEKCTQQKESDAQNAEAT